ncbi:MAG: hypothetical protein IJ549_05875 [Prevotella sp.]|nr:hypothetical protein [Prevotella sp.]
MEKMSLANEFVDQSTIGILRLIATAGKHKDVDCMHLSHFCPQTADTSIYAFVSNNDVVFLMIYWESKDDKLENIVARLKEFVHQYKEAMKDAGIPLPHISSVLVTNIAISSFEQKDVIVYNNIQMEQMPYVHYSLRYHAIAKSQFVAFRQWCEKQGYLARDPYAYEDIDADYNEMEYGIDDEDDDQAFLEKYLSTI